MLDSTTTDETLPEKIWPEFMSRLPPSIPVTIIRNKADISGEAEGTALKTVIPPLPFS